MKIRNIKATLKTDTKNPLLRRISNARGDFDFSDDEAIAFLDSAFDKNSMSLSVSHDLNGELRLFDTSFSLILYEEEPFGTYCPHTRVVFDIADPNFVAISSVELIHDEIALSTKAVRIQCATLDDNKVDNSVTTRELKNTLNFENGGSFHAVYAVEFIGGHKSICDVNIDITSLFPIRNIKGKKGVDD